MITLPYKKYRLGQCTINCCDMTLTNAENSVTLPAKVFEFLKLLILHPTETVTKEQAIEQVWQGNIEVGKRGTGNAIWQLRKSLSELGLKPEDYFKTVTKVGYQLLIEPQPITSILPRKVASKKTINPITGILLLICISLLTSAVYFSQAIQPLPATSAASKKPQRITNFEGVEERAAISTDGRFMAFQWRKEGAKGQLFIKDLKDDTAPLRQISMSHDTESVPSWSPDGRSLAYLRTTADNQCYVHVRDLISNQDKQLDSGCISKGYLHSLEWSPDGHRLAYVKAIDEQSAVHLYNFENQNVSQLSLPHAGEHDLMMTWAPNSKQLVFMRSQDNMIAEIKRIDIANKQMETLITGETLVIGLDWDHSHNQIYYTALRDADFVIMQYDVSTKNLTEFHRDETISSLAIDESHQHIYYARHISQEHITHRSLADGHVIKQLISSSRDLYGQYLAKTDQLLFLSNRSGDWELWLKGNNGNTMLTDDIGMISLPAASPNSSLYALPIRPKGETDNALYIGNTLDASLQRITAITGNVRYASFSASGQQIYYSALVNNRWGLYRYDLNSQQVNLVIDDNVKYAIEDNQQGLYYTLDNTSGIFYRNNQQHTVQVNHSLRAKDWGSFFVQDDRLFFLERSDDHDVIAFLDNQGQQQQAFTLPAMSVRNERSLASGRNGTVIVSMQGINDADIYRIDL